MITLGGLTKPDTMCRRICVMLEEGGVLTQAGLIAQTGLTKGSVSKYLTALTAGGYVKPVGDTAIVGIQRRGYARTALPLPDARPLPVASSMQELAMVMVAMVRSAR